MRIGPIVRSWPNARDFWVPASIGESIAVGASGFVACGLVPSSWYLERGQLSVISLKVEERSSCSSSKTRLEVDYSQFMVRFVVDIINQLNLNRYGGLV